MLVLRLAISSRCAVRREGGHLPAPGMRPEIPRADPRNANPSQEIRQAATAKAAFQTARSQTAKATPSAVAAAGLARPKNLRPIACAFPPASGRLVEESEYLDCLRAGRGLSRVGVCDVFPSARQPTKRGNQIAGPGCGAVATCRAQSRIRPVRKNLRSRSARFWRNTVSTATATVRTRAV